MKAEAVSTTQEAVRADSVILEIPLEKIRESKTNPRTQFDQSKLAELAAFVPRNKCSICGANQFERIRSTVVGLRKYCSSMITSIQNFDWEVHHASERTHYVALL